MLATSRRGVSPTALHEAVNGRVVLVTGASEGIGREVARSVARAGAITLVLGRTQSRLEELATELGPNVHPLVCDLSDPVAVGETCAKITAEFGHVDVLVSNAGKSIRRSLADTFGRLHDVQRLTDVNFIGPVALLLGLLPAMQEHGGHVVNVSTIGVLLPPAPRWAAYMATKSAFDVWLRGVATELTAVTVSSVYFGLVHTRMSAPTSDFRNVPGLSPAEAAGVVARAIVERPVAISPWWARLANVAGSASQRGTHVLMRRYGQRVGA